MISDQALTAWLCAFWLQLGEGRAFFLPTSVTAQLVARGWLTISEEVDWEGDHVAGLTDAGRVIVDLNGAEYGLDVMPAEVE